MNAELLKQSTGSGLAESRGGAPQRLAATQARGVWSRTKSQKRSSRCTFEPGGERRPEMRLESRRIEHTLRLERMQRRVRHQHQLGAPPQLQWQIPSCYRHRWRHQLPALPQSNPKPPAVPLAATATVTAALATAFALPIRYRNRHTPWRRWRAGGVGVGYSDVVCLQPSMSAVSQDLARLQLQPGSLKPSAMQR